MFFYVIIIFYVLFNKVQYCITMIQQYGYVLCRYNHIIDKYML